MCQGAVIPARIEKVVQDLDNPGRDRLADIYLVAWKDGRDSATDFVVASSRGVISPQDTLIVAVAVADAVTGKVKPSSTSSSSEVFESDW